MPAEEILKSVYGMIAKRDLASSVAAWQSAKPVAAEAEGAVQLALYEAIADSLSALLTEIAEHGAQNRALWGIAASDVDVWALNEECEQAWAAISRLRSGGLSSGPLIKPYVGSWMDPIGSRDWLNQMRLGVRHRKEPGWLDRAARLARD
jgi:hypothetical protein